jgi:NDP-sugar pyrophosphorylase family protein
LDENNHILKFKEKRKAGDPGLINAGVYLFSSEILGEIAVSGPSLEHDFLQNQQPGRLYAMWGKYTFLDIGTPKDLARAPKILDKYYNCL